MDTLSDRLKKALAAADISQRQLAKMIGVSPATINLLLNGTTKTLKAATANKAAAALDVSARWLAEGVGEMKSLVSAVQEEAQSDDYIEIPEYEIKVGAGSKDFYYQVVTDNKKAYYRQEWFAEHHTNPANCKRFRVEGDSMMPLLWDGDRITVDTAYQQIIDGKVYCFMLDYQMRVKRLIKRLDGGLLIKSENPDYPDEALKPDEMERFRMVGRVIDRSGNKFL